MLCVFVALACYRCIMSLAELAKMADAGKAKYQLQKLCLTYAEKVMPLRTQGPKLLSTTLCPYKRLAYIAGLRDWMRVAQLQCSLCRKGAKPKTHQRGQQKPTETHTGSASSSRFQTAGGEPVVASGAAGNRKLWDMAEPDKNRTELRNILMQRPRDLASRSQALLAR